MIECTVNYYQNAFNASKIVEKLSDYDDFLNQNIKTKIFISDNFFPSNMGETAKSFDSKERSAIINTNKIIMRRCKNGSDQNSIKNDENAKSERKENREGWTKPTKYALIECFSRNAIKEPKKIRISIDMMG